MHPLEVPKSRFPNEGENNPQQRPQSSSSEIPTETAAGIRVLVVSAGFDPRCQALRTGKPDARAVAIARGETIVAELLGRGAVARRRPVEGRTDDVVVALAEPHAVGARRQDVGYAHARTEEARAFDDMGGSYRLVPETRGR